MEALHECAQESETTVSQHVQKTKAKKPLAHALRIAGIKPLDFWGVKSEQMLMKVRYCSQRVNYLGSTLAHLHAFDFAHSFNSALHLVGWVSFSYEEYLFMGQNTRKAERAGIFYSAVPQAVVMIAREVRQRVPGAVLTVEAFLDDPYLRVQLDNEDYYLAYWQ